MSNLYTWHAAALRSMDVIADAIERLGINNMDGEEDDTIEQLERHFRRLDAMPTNREAARAILETWNNEDYNQ